MALLKWLSASNDPDFYPQNSVTRGRLQGAMYGPAGPQHPHLTRLFTS